MATSWSDEMDGEDENVANSPEKFLTPQRGMSLLDWRCGRGHFQSLTLGSTCRKCGSELRLPQGYNALEISLGIGQEESETTVHPEPRAAVESSDMEEIETAKIRAAEPYIQPGHSGWSSQEISEFGLVRCNQNHVFRKSFECCNICAGIPVENVKTVEDSDEEDDPTESESSDRKVDGFGLTVCSKGHVFHISMVSCNVCGPDKKIKTPEKDDSVGPPRRRRRYSPVPVRPIISRMMTNFKKYSEDKEQGPSSSCMRMERDSGDGEE